MAAWCGQQERWLRAEKGLRYSSAGCCPCVALADCPFGNFMDLRGFEPLTS
jgi:hypothetical protein